MSDLRLPPVDAELDLPRPGAERRSWVRIVDRELVLTTRTELEGGRSAVVTRPLSRRERLAWYALRRTPAA